jgi:hypothetical protein
MEGYIFLYQEYQSKEIDGIVHTVLGNVYVKPKGTKLYWFEINTTTDELVD